MIKDLLRPIYVPLEQWYFNTFKAPKRYHHLYDEITRIKAVRILEVGTWNGARAEKMINVAKQYGAVTYTGFDLFEDLTDDLFHLELSKRAPAKSDVLAALEKTGAKITLIQGNTLKTLPDYLSSGEKFDFAFIDGGHHVDTIMSDWKCVSELMDKNSVVIFDDYWRNRPDASAKPVVDTIDTSIYNVEILPEIDCFDNPDFGRLEISFTKVTRK